MSLKSACWKQTGYWRLCLKQHHLQVSEGKGLVALVVRVLSYIRGGRHALETEDTNATSDSELQTSDSEDDPDDSDCLETDFFVKHGCKVLFVPDADVQRVAYSTKQVVNSGIFKLLL